MHVAILFEYPTLYGGERSMLAAIQAMDRRSLSLTAIVPPEGQLVEALRKLDVPIEPFQVFDQHRKRRPRGTVVPELQATLNRLAPDVVHANSLSMSVLTGELDGTYARSGHIRDMISLSANAVRLLNRNHRLLAVSQATRDYHIGRGIDIERLHVVYNGVAHAEFDQLQPSGSLRSSLGIPDDSIVSLTVGQIGLRKGLDVLVDAGLKAVRRCPQLHLIFAGERISSKDESVEFEQSLYDRVRSAGAENRFHWLGYRSDVPALMKECNFLIHAAHQEPLGRVLLEAAASTLPIVATRVGGTAEILEDGISGRLVPPADPAALAAAICELADDPGLRRRFALAARQRSEARFGIRNSADTVVDHWREVVAERHSEAGG